MKKLLASLAVFSVVLAGCNAGPKDEKQAFIDATIEATCHIFQAENIFDPALEDEAKEIYEDHGFDANDDAAMEALTAKYEDDEEVQNMIMAGIEECGGDLFSALDEAFEGLEDVDLEADVDAVEDKDEDAVEDKDEE